MKQNTAAAARWKNKLRKAAFFVSGGIVLPAFAAFMAKSAGAVPARFDGAFYALYFPAYAAYVWCVRRMSGTAAMPLWQRALLLAWLYLAVCGVVLLGVAVW